MLPIETILGSAHIVVDDEGCRTAIQLDWKIWEQLQAVLEDLEDIAEIESARQEEEPVFSWAQVQEEAGKVQRVPGLGVGTIWMSDDFDAPLPDSFWLGEDENHEAVA